MTRFITGCEFTRGVWVFSLAEMAFSHLEVLSSVKWRFHPVNLSCRMLETVFGHRVKFTLLIMISQIGTGLTSTLDAEAQERQT